MRPALHCNKRVVSGGDSVEENRTKIPDYGFQRMTFAAVQIALEKSIGHNAAFAGV